MKKTELQAYLEKVVSEILDKLEVDAVISVEAVDGEEKNYFSVNLEVEEGSPELIGRHGSMLESLATVFNAMIVAKTRDQEESWRVILDVNNYRRERTEYIEELTEGSITRVIADGQPVSLSPMKPWERRVVHMKVSDRSEIETTSEGEGAERHIIISLAN